MMKFIKNNVITFIIIILMFSALFIRVDAFSFSMDPVVFIQRTTDTIVSRVSDIIYYLVMQKKYIFDGYTDVNNSAFVNIPDGLEKKISIATSTKSTPVFKDESKSLDIFPKPVLNINSIVVPDVFDTPNDIDIQILNNTNIERENISISDLVLNNNLNKIAYSRANDLFSNQYFEHISPSGNTVSDLAKKIGYEYFLIGENLALGKFSSSKDIVMAWMASPEHKANILNEKYKEMGIAVKDGYYKGENVTIAVQVFALPQAVCPKPNQTVKDLIDSSTVTITQMQGEALIMFNNLNTIKNISGIDLSYYNQKIKEYNNFAKKINDATLALKGMIDIYNVEVSDYNYCIKN